MSVDERDGAAGSWTRRRFVQLTAASAMTARIGLAQAGTETHGTMMDVPFDRREPRIGFIGVGSRGTSLLQDMLGANGKVVALCDPLKEKAEHAAGLVTAAGQAKPTLYTNGTHAFEAMLSKDDIDLVVVATPWIWHAEQAIFAMKHGKDVVVEVPGVRTLEECWALVKTSEETRKHCMMLENCCYGYNETLVLRMIHAGKFGELLYGEGAYLHDLREELFSDHNEGLWRRTEHTLRNGNLYPTHGLGPVANYMSIQRGDRFSHMVSMSSPQRGLDAYRKQHLKAGDPRMAERYVTGDMNTSMIQTANGLTITVKHTVSTPRPYDRVNQIAGTQGVFEDYPPRLFLEQGADEKAQKEQKEEWGGLDAWKQYEHPLWRQEGEKAKEVGGHGGMDFIMLYRLLQCVRGGMPPDMDVYDAAAWASVAALSVQSVAQGSAPVECPDFTGGHWKQRPISAIATQT